MVSKTTRTVKPSTVSTKTLDEILEIPDNYRIYVVCANTVQCPTTLETVENPLVPFETSRLVFDEDTRTVNQIPGRVMAQGEHVVSLMREYLLRQAFQKAMHLNVLPSVSDGFWSRYCVPVTTINLEAHDSRELLHVYDLMVRTGIPCHAFHDFNQPDYGSTETRVMTAICTEPVHPDWMFGVTDYLNLWKPLKV